MEPSPLVVAFELSEKRKSIVADGFAGASAIIYLAELDGAGRAEALRKAGALLTHNTAKDLRSGEAALLLPHCERSLEISGYAPDSRKAAQRQYRVVRAIQGRNYGLRNETC
jgi:hypothetical protein